MDFVPEKSALEVDEIRESEKAMGYWPSRPSGEGTSTEGTIKDADGEGPLPITASEEEEPTRVHAVISEEIRPPIAEVAYPFVVVVDSNAVLGLANATLPQHGVSHLLALHRFHELRWKAEAVLGPGEHRDYEGGPPFGRGVGRRLERRQRQLKPRWTEWWRGRRAGHRGARGSGPEGSKSFLILAAWWLSWG
jgi:hypothetical protein